MFTKEMLNDYANKLLFDLSDEECQTLLDEFDAIKSHMELIANIPNIEKVKPMHFPTEMKLENLRSGEEISNISNSDVIKNSDSTIEGMIKVPKVVE